MYGRPACSRCGHSILPPWFLLSSSFFLACCQPSQIGCLPYFHTWCDLSANLGCRSETCCMRVAENTGRKTSPKNSLSAHHRTIFSGCTFATKENIGSRKKLFNSNISSTCPHNMVNFGPLAAEIVLPLWGTQQISTAFACWLRYCTDVAQRRSTKLCTLFGRLLG